MPRSKQVKVEPAKKRGWPAGKKRGPRNPQVAAMHEVTSDSISPQVMQAAKNGESVLPSMWLDEVYSTIDGRIAKLQAARNQLAEAAKVLGL